MSNRDGYHVVPDKDGWALRREGSERASATGDTQSEMIREGQRLAEREKTELFIHRPNGQIRDRDSYGNDPCPPKDKKH